MRADPQRDIYSDFRDSVTPDLHNVETYIAWDMIEAEISDYGDVIEFLQSDFAGTPMTDVIETGMKHFPGLYEVLALLLAVHHGAGFSDGRELPDYSHPPDAAKHHEIAGLLVEMGVERLLQPGRRVDNLVRVALIAQDARRRRSRVGETIKERLRVVLDQALHDASHQHGIELAKLSNSDWPQPARGRADWVLAVDGRPRIAIASAFETAFGGRQQKDLLNYVYLRQELLEHGTELVLVPDGRGIRDVPGHTLDALFSGVPNCMTYRQAADGLLLSTLVRLSAGVERGQETRSLDRIISDTLGRQGSVAVDVLPVDVDRARLALAMFAEKDPGLDLVLDATSRELSWGRRGLVQNLNMLQQSFSAHDAIDCFSELIETTGTQNQEEQSDLAISVQIVGSDRVLPHEMTVAACAGLPNTASVRQVATIALRKTPSAKVCVLLSPSSPESTVAASLRGLQPSLPANVLLIDTDQLLAMAKHKGPARDLLVQQLLEQSDLVKASPFVVNSVTPGRMFYGRENEAAFLISTLSSNSVALLGGRRIGKTSFMINVDSQLRSAGFTTYFGDCQTVRNWDDFSALAKRLWRVPVRESFTPSAFFEIIEHLRSKPDSKVVIILDEIDQLLDWDMFPSENKVPEAFFRACRTVSQEGRAQFVFSGERRIAGRLWDAHSPHWNFCHPLMLRQLDRAAARLLLIAPLENMRIQISDHDDFASTAWSRTSGHPQLLQFLGDSLMRSLNERPAGERGLLRAGDLLQVTDTYAFAEHYLETYWGQSSPIERLVSLLVASGVDPVADIGNDLRNRGIDVADDRLRSALRMLQLYGIVEPSGRGYRLELEWFAEALGYYGDIEKLMALYMRQSSV